MTFTDKAAGELKGRLSALGVHGVRASTFHSAPRCGSSATSRRTRSAASCRRRRSRCARSRTACPARSSSAPPPTSRPRSNGRRTAASTLRSYREAAADREPPIPVDLMHRVYREYEERKAAEGLLDFEDLLERTVQLFERDTGACATFRAQYVAFTVDEYQDVNLLQQTLLDLWLGDRDDLCVVGDDYQSIYAFTGAGPEHLLGVPRRFPHATVVRLEENYRSTPQVLALANRLVPKLGGAEKVLRAVRPGRPRARRPPVRVLRGRRRRDRRVHPRARLPARRRRDPRADERAADGLRGAAARRGHPVPGRLAARARGGAALDPPARALERSCRRGGSRRRARRRLAPEPAGEARRPRIRAADRPRSARLARRVVRR